MRISYSIHREATPVIATAIHSGHLIDEQLRPFLSAGEQERFREEDPYTEYMAELPASRVLVHTSRFQTDLNRPPEKAVYQQPEDAWGLQVWNTPLPAVVLKALQQGYRRFYEEMKMLIEYTLQHFGKAVVLDIHSYNHRRTDPFTPAPDATHPEINLGTAYNLESWHPVCRRYAGYLSECTVNGKRPDVRENVRFKGGWLAQWAIAHYGAQLCVFSMEFKKTFMDEWTGRPDWRHITDIQKALGGSIPFLKYELKSSGKHL